ncbi:cytochrome d ubiquinol oxidase subunit II [Hyphococcus lacteus]|uniref:Cytochrome d ubiquinol oxidase subunit II n=1 Tax=Hyphococcus lacteus TaxID=3143536 RepID=A0ABV3Z1S0_9PROT
MDYALIWAILIAVAVMMYVLLDGFDLGIGILTAFASDEAERSLMTATIEPVWDGNETWLVLGGGGLLAAFPLAYSILIPAFYIPVLIMLAALIFRGVAFEFRHKAVRNTTKRFWNGAFFGGSLAAAFSQGIILGAFIQGIEVSGRAYAGGGYDWLTPFSLMVGAAVVVGYVLLGSCWLILKTEGATRDGARKWARRTLIGVGLAMAAISLATLSIDPRVTERWGISMTEIDFGKFLFVSPIPLAGAVLIGFLWRELTRNSSNDWLPIVLAAGIFLTGYLGFAVSLFPYNVPFSKTIWETAAHDTSLKFLLVGGGILLPTILVYTVYVYSLFWGKVRPGEGYHA